MIPFDLSRMDGIGASTSSSQSIVDRVYDIARLYLGVNDKCRDAAALLIAKSVCVCMCIIINNEFSLQAGDQTRRQK